MDPNIIQVKDLPNGKKCALYRFIFTVGLLVEFNPNDHSNYYSGRFCYKNLSDANEAISLWDGQGDPPGPWLKYKGIYGERRNPNYI